MKAGRPGAVHAPGCGSRTLPLDPAGGPHSCQASMNAPPRHKPSRRRRARGSGDRRDNSQPRQPPHTRSTRISCETPDLKSHSQRAGGHPRLRRAPQRGSASPRRRSPIGMRESSRAWSSMPFRFPAVTSSPMSIQISAAARTRRPAICRSTRAALGASRRGQRSRALPPSSRHSSIPIQATIRRLLGPASRDHAELSIAKLGRARGCSTISARRSSSAAARDEGARASGAQRGPMPAPSCWSNVEQLVPASRRPRRRSPPKRVLDEGEVVLVSETLVGL